MIKHFLPALAALFVPALSSPAFSQAVTIGDGADVTQGAIADAAATAGGPGTAAAKLRLMTSQLNAILAGVQSPANFASQYPSGAIPVTNSATGTTSATAATLAAHATKTTFICGFSIRANATAAATGNSTVTGTVSGTLNFTQWTAPLASGVGITEMIFTPCVPGSTANSAIIATSAAPGSGGVVSVTAWGYQL
jgi:hypothetical protein